MKNEDDETVRSIRKTSCREVSAPGISRPFACFRLLRIWPRATNDLLLRDDFPVAERGAFVRTGIGDCEEFGSDSKHGNGAVTGLHRDRFAGRKIT